MNDMTTTRPERHVYEADEHGDCTKCNLPRMNQIHEARWVMMPDGDEIMRRLTAAVDEPHAIEHLYPAIVRSLANTPKNAMGVVIAIGEAISAYSKTMPPILVSMLMSRLTIESYVAALIEDSEPEMFADAMAFLDGAESDMANRRTI